MSIRYTAGSGRVGRRKLQMRIHLKWVRAIQKALRAFARPWSDLPSGRLDYEIFDLLEQHAG